MKYICHRINHACDLDSIDTKYGAEIDLRDNLDGSIYLEHDPFTAGEDFENYLKSYHHGLLILNVKSERVEEKVLSMIKNADVKEFFFLDSSFPMIHLLSQKGIYNTALRFSEYEGMDTIRNMSGNAEWVWVDCFTKCPLTKENYAELKQLNYKICIVSPELQGRQDDVEEYARELLSLGVTPDAICTKSYNIPLWKRYFE